MSGFLFVCNIVLAGIFGIKLLNTKTGDASRGTNCVTRFVRDVASNTVYTQTITLCGVATILFLIIGAIAGCPWVCIPTIIPIGFSFYLKLQSNKSQQRVKDARVVTKTTGKVVAATGTAVAATACAATGVGAVATAGIVAGAAGASRVVDKSVNTMTDVDGPDISKEDFKELNTFASKFTGIDIEHPEEFIEAATRAGINTEGRDLREVAANVIQFAPKAALEELPEDLSVEEKAMRIMKGAVV